MGSNTTQDSDVDDYMSDTFTAVDLRPGIFLPCFHSNFLPGIAKTRSQKRSLEMEAKQAKNIEYLQKIPKRSEIEKKMRDDALAQPVSENSKGFLLLTKMGYKPGMSLGVEKDNRSQGIKVPLGLELKLNRTGLGHDAEEDRKRNQRMDRYQNAVLQRAKANTALINDFSVRKRRMAYLKQLQKDLCSSRKACQELDARKGLELPTNSHFWPIYEVKKEEILSLVAKKETEETEDIKEKVFTYFNGKMAPTDYAFEELLDEDVVVQWLNEITIYLRTSYFYCIWCGTQYDSENELLNNCPGNSRKDHEGSDEDN
ncbi:unnamed protein product [Thelazia callipaeda]|uniref:G patch domain-containing protein 11 n=1 Tax=Thelazia callipaeda TaxID=103827 RepID=A0A0N5D6J7_THECL|nr:unnamed protein product [Thelazia callipaeda]